MGGSRFVQSLRSLARLIVLFVGASFLLGQPFNGFFSVAATLTGVAGLALGAFTQDRKINDLNIQYTILVLGLLCLLGAGLDVYGYYSEVRQSGNYYPWILVAPFLVAVLFLMWQFRVRVTDTQIEQEHQ